MKIKAAKTIKAADWKQVGMLGGPPPKPAVAPAPSVPVKVVSRPPPVNRPGHVLCYDFYHVTGIDTCQRCGRCWGHHGLVATISGRVQCNPAECECSTCQHEGAGNGS